MSSSEVEIKLKNLFQFYASYGDRMNTKYIKSSKIHKLLQNAHIYDHKTVDKTTVDIIICNISKANHNIAFPEFIEILGRLSMLVYTGRETVTDKQVAIQCMQKLLSDHIFKYLDNLCTSNQEITINFPPAIGETFRRIYSSYAPVYRAYFPWEINSPEDVLTLRDKSLKQLYAFLKDFDICPSVVSKSYIQQLWQDLILNQTYADQILSNLSTEFLPPKKINEGRIFSYLYLCYFVVKIAEKAFNIREFQDLPIYDKLDLLLERMELSSGWRDVSLKLNRTQSGMSLKNSQENNHSMIGHSQSHSFLQPQNSFTNGNNKQSHSFLGLNTSNFKESVIFSPVQDEEYAPILAKYKIALRSVFEYYCAFGEPMNKTKMKSSKFLKFMKDLGVLGSSNANPSPLYTAEGVDVLFSYLLRQGMNRSALRALDPREVQSRSSKKNYIELDQFINVNVEVALKLPSNIQKASSRLEYYLSDGVFASLIMRIKDTQNSSKKNCLNAFDLDSALQYLSDDKWYKVLEVLQKSLKDYYFTYAQDRGLMDFTRFMKFLQDFEVYPSLISKSYLHSIFYALAQRYSEIYHKEHEPGPNVQKTESIDEILFYQALIVISVSTHMPLYNDDVQKLCGVVERMSQSNGPVYVYRNKGFNLKYRVQWAIIQPFVDEFPQYFNQTPKKENVSMLDLMGSFV